MLFKLVKHIIKAALGLTGVSLLGCSSGYQEKDGTITFNGKKITDKHFVVLNQAFAKDSLYVYYKEKTINGADPASFAALDESYAKDNSHVYYCDESRDGRNYYLTKTQDISVVENADPASFTLIEASYAKDKQYGFYGGHSFAVKDIASLKGIDPQFSKDDVQAYFNGQPVPGSHGKTFELINSSYAKDSNHIYFIKPLRKVAESVFALHCQPASFKVLDYPFSKDESTIFYENRVVAGADAASFSVLANGYAKDKNAVYLQAKRIAGADPASFELFKPGGEYVSEDFYSKDKQGIYWMDKKIITGDNPAFAPLGNGYAADGKQVWFKTATISGADANTFKVYPHDVGDADAEDAATKYHSGKKIR